MKTFKLLSMFALSLLLHGCFLRSEFNIVSGPINSDLDLTGTPDGDYVAPEQHVAIIHDGSFQAIRIGETGPGAADFVTGNRPHNLSAEQPNYAIRFSARKDFSGSFNPSVIVSFLDEEGYEAGRFTLVGNSYPVDSQNPVSLVSWNTYYIELNMNTSTWKYWISSVTGVYESPELAFIDRRFDMLDRMRVDILCDVPDASIGCKNNFANVFFDLDYLSIFPSDAAFTPIF
ncbi:MAG: hypothetical protein HWE27_04450 [Gammaproteobacteria bacterium]|nr:hypothetical protein [Gammaproteobacteria bacterium]